MIHDARQVPRGTTLEAQLCIVGAGAAGITIAREFIGRRLPVILLESGGHEMERRNQSLYQGENIGHRYADLHILRARYLGGSTNCWGGWCRPLDPIDFEKRDWVPHSGWPFGRDELVPYYERAQDICSLGPNEYGPDYWANAMEDDGFRPMPLSDDRVVTQISHISREPRFSRTYGDELGSAENVQTYLNANVLEIEVNETASRVTHLRVGTFAGTEFRVTAKYIVLATGGIENPRLLLASNKTQTAGLGNGNDLVGRFFMEHPQLSLGRLALDKADESTKFYDPHHTFFHSPVSANLALTEEVQRAEQLLNYKSWVVSVYRGEKTKGGEALRNIYRAARQPTLPDQFIDTGPAFWLTNFGVALADFPNAAALACGRLSKHPWFVASTDFIHLCEAVPNPESRVTLGDDKDHFGLNRVRVDWRLSMQEKRTIRRAQQIIAEELERAGYGRMEGELLDDSHDDWPDELLWGWHQMGTTRMHDDPKQGVVDANSRVHGLANLFVAGSSVFPTSGNDLVTITIVALSLRLAEHIAGELADARPLEATPA